MGGGGGDGRVRDWEKGRKGQVQVRHGVQAWGADAGVEEILTSVLTWNLEAN